MFTKVDVFPFPLGCCEKLFFQVHLESNLIYCFFCVSMNLVSLSICALFLGISVQLAIFFLLQLFPVYPRPKTVLLYFRLLGLGLPTVLSILDPFLAFLDG